MNPLIRFFSKSEIIRHIKSFQFAIKGLKIFFSTQINAFIEVLATFFIIVAGIYFNLSLYEWALVIIAIGIVFIAEIFNTSIEFLTDLVSPQYNETAGKVKDIAAAGVLVAAIVALVLGLIVFVPKLSNAF
ncbi:MAG: diacylglycerol kinase family protein [Bacteroidota bacterium]|nr:diacylglycerol kinase family protein [Bacteroidota bacterium]